MLQTAIARQSLLARIPLRRPTPPSPSRPPQHTLPVLYRFPIGSIFISAFLCFLGIGLYMWPRVQGVRLAYQVQGAEQRLKDLLQERDHLRLELAGLSDPQRVYHIATEQLGMVIPSHDQLFILVHESQRR